ncbi:MAG: hypothetical protein SWY16_01345 [Cyanobacteriota bacterium]|nr:hypothetical protein [Cyanobacteriota bacterium]
MEIKLNYAKYLEPVKKYPFASVSLALTTLFLIFGAIVARQTHRPLVKELDCGFKISTEETIQLETLQQLKNQEGSDRSAVEQLLGGSHCTLPKMAIREGAILDREVYYTAENARSIVAYEDGQYLGYGIEDLDRTGQWWEAESESRGPRSVREIELQNTWGVKAGESIDRYLVASGLGDISLAMKGKVLAPLDGNIEHKFVLISDGSLIRGTSDCVIFSSPQMPAYLIKLCGLASRNFNRIESGKPIGETNGYLHISLFSYRPNPENGATWVYVPPSPQLIQNLVAQR